MSIEINAVESIKVALENRFSTGHACFREFRTLTGFAPARFIDFLAVGMWEKTFGIKAFEIKVSRNDFMKDVSEFEQKQGDALEISHEFYYVCSWGLIDKSEVPDIAGLFYIDKSNKPKKQKQAPRRKLDAIPISYFLAFAREFGHKIEHTKMPIKYLGKELRQDDFLQLVEEKKDWSFNRDVENKAREINDKLIKENNHILGLFNRIKRECGGSYFRDVSDDELIEHISRALEFSRDYENIKRPIGF